jgi:hypothetical protein
LRLSALPEELRALSHDDGCASISLIVNDKTCAVHVDLGGALCSDE